MDTWTEGELDRIGKAEELQLSSFRQTEASVPT